MRKLLLAVLILGCISCKKDPMPIANGTVIKLNLHRITSYGKLAQNGIVPIDPLTVERSYQKYGEDGYWYVINDGHKNPTLEIDIDGRDIEK